MRRSFKFKLYHSRNDLYLARQIGVAGIIYNHCIALHKRYYRLFGKHLNKNQLQKHLTKLKKLKKYEFWNSVGSQAIQEVTERIDKGYKRFFDHVKARKYGKVKEKVSPPKFRKVKKYKSFTLKQAGWKLAKENVIIINKKRYNYLKSREILGSVKRVVITVKKRESIWPEYIEKSLFIEMTTNGNWRES